jgi:hypothetical protein
MDEDTGHRETTPVDDPFGFREEGVISCIPEIELYRFSEHASSILVEVKPPTGEPDAGDPPVRFGGRGDRNQSALPTPIESLEKPGFRVAPGLDPGLPGMMISPCFQEFCKRLY